MFGGIVFMVMKNSLAYNKYSNEWKLGLLDLTKMDYVYSLRNDFEVSVSSSNKEHKILYRWISEQYEARLTPQLPSQEFVNNIIGTYEDSRKIISENSIVYYVGSIGIKRILTFMGKQTFILEGRDDYRLRFQVDQTSADYYEVFWYNGTSEKVNRGI
jgi:hypothetical protein